MLNEHAKQIIAKIGDWVKRHREHLWTAVLLVLAGWSTFNLGLIRGRQGTAPLQEAAVFQPRQGIVSQAPAATSRGVTKPAQDRSDQRVVVSKSSSSKKYHYAWCPGAKQIKESNRVWYPSATDAQAAGYSLAGNCQP